MAVMVAIMKRVAGVARAGLVGRETGHGPSDIEKEAKSLMRRLLGARFVGLRPCRRALVFVGFSLALVGCGFHLRTAREFALPSALSVLRVTMPASGLKYPGLLLVVRRALLDRGVTVVSKGNVPAVVLMSETMTPLIVTINSNGGATAYLLDYQVTFSLQGPHGRILMSPSAVRVQREYSFDPLNILAMAREQAYLQKRMRLAAARQIVWRLAAFKAAHRAAQALPKAARHAP